VPLVPPIEGEARALPPRLLLGRFICVDDFGRTTFTHEGARVSVAFARVAPGRTCSGLGVSDGRRSEPREAAEGGLVMRGVHHDIEMRTS
jgi:hypothetical protein